MNFQSYLDYFQNIIDTADGEHEAPYDAPEYIDYTRMNWARMNRWLKNGKLNEELANKIKAITDEQQWILITEPWCGDAAHSVPFIKLLADLNPKITLEIELRDSEPFRINDYLTGTSKSIPKVVFKNAEGEDLGVWGPRPESCQEIYSRLTAENADFEATKVELQKWYNADKGLELQKELLDLLF